MEIVARACFRLRLESAAVDLAKTIRHQYTIAYVPVDQTFDGTYRTIRLTVNRSGKYRVHTRSGYRAIVNDRE